MNQQTIYLEKSPIPKSTADRFLGTYDQQTHTLHLLSGCFIWNPLEAFGSIPGRGLSVSMKLLVTSFSL